MLYRYIFRGIGVVFVAGMLTALLLAIYDQAHSLRSRPTQMTQPSASKGARR